VSLAEIREAQARIAEVAYHTPLLPGRRGQGVQTWLKPENLQPIGSFKIRGAYNRIAALSAAERQNGVVAYSSGNHAQGVAYAARQLGIAAVIVMPDNAPAIKVAATRSYGAEVVIYNYQTEKREEVAARIAAERGAVIVPPYNNRFVVAGQGTIGLEIFEDLPQVDLVFTPVGGGGLISGVAAALKHLKPSVRVIGVEPEFANDAQQSLRLGKIVSVTPGEAARTIADGVRTLSVGDITFEHIQAFVDDIVTVSEAAIYDALRRCATHHKLIVEPSGALPLAAWITHQAHYRQAQNVVFVISGGNIDPTLLKDML
jgi:threonine dehydratase